VLHAEEVRDITRCTAAGASGTIHRFRFEVSRSSIPDAQG
jgi:hypothetical protein